MTCTTTTLEVSVHLAGKNPVFGEGNTYVRLEDEGGGAFIVLRQTDDDSKPGEIRLDPLELEAVVRATKQLIAQKAIA
jgi:hypothetical protein